MSDYLCDGTEWLIHRFKCPNCREIARADRAVRCFRCRTQMNHVERIGEVYDVSPDRDEEGDENE